MALKNPITHTVLNASLLVVVLASLFFNNPISASALDRAENALPDFTDFSQTVLNGKANILRGVYVSEVLAMPVVQQPAGSPGYVSHNDGEVTQFSMAARYGNVGLLAHNHLAGKYFSRLAVGQEVRLVYGNGKVEYFIVSEVLRYQALEPNSPWSSFRNLSGDEVLSAEEMFKRVYFGDHHVTFQTCIEKNGELSWGRMFIVAVPKSVFFMPDRSLLLLKPA